MTTPTREEAANDLESLIVRLAAAESHVVGQDKAARRERAELRDARQRMESALRVLRRIPLSD